jgi:cold shock CspA family protein
MQESFSRARSHSAARRARAVAGESMTDHRTRGIKKAAPAAKAAVVRPEERRGTPSSGRIVALVLGQGQGFIRSADDLKVFFHRSDLCEGTSLHDLAVGDRVTFEQLDDAISGPRALRVQRGRSRR